MAIEVQQKRPSLSQRLVAWVMARHETTSHERHQIQKQALLGNLTGTVVEIGPGTGVNLVYYAPTVHWIGVEPNPAMYPHLHKNMARLGQRAEVRMGTAEKLPLPDGSADAVVSTLVLCSVADPAQVLAEIYRVLKKNGRFVFMEHVAAPAGTRARRVQDVLNPVWKRLADGCHLNRETADLLAAAGFSSLDWQPLDGEHRVALLPQIVGVAVK